MTALGVTLSNLDAPDDQHPVVLSIAEAGAAATPACQFQGQLMVGDRILTMTGATNVHAMDWKHGCKEAEHATINMLKKSRSRTVNVRVERDGAEKVVTVEKTAHDSSLGLTIESNTAWAHPVVREVEPKSPCRGVIQLGDKVKSVEAAFDDVTLDTRHASEAKVATGFLKDLVGPVSFVVLRLDDVKARTLMVEAMVAEAAIAPKTAEAHAEAQANAGGIISMARMKLWRERSGRHSRINLLSSQI